MREGPTLNKELLGISNLINSFSVSSSDPPYEDCKTNLLLQEVFGGNCVSFGVVCLDVSSDTNTNAVVLDYANRMRVIENYPVINNNRMRGLLIKYHKRYNNVLRQLEAVQKQHLDNVNSHTTNVSNTEAKLLEFRYEE